MRAANGDGSIFYRPSKDRWFGAAYVLQADGTYARREVSHKDRDQVVQKLRKLQTNSDQGIPAEANNWNVEAFLQYWLEHIVKPSKKPKTYQGYELVARVHLIPQLGKKKLHKLTGADVRLFMKRMRNTCLCCLHGYDERRGAARSIVAASGSRPTASWSRFTPYCETHCRRPSGRKSSNATSQSWCR